MKTIYKDWTIEPETNPWAKLFGSKVKFYLDGERVYSADSIDEAKSMIDELEAPIINGNVLCWIQWADRDVFVNELQAVVEKYYI